jgi:hypothetical protein
MKAYINLRKIDRSLVGDHLRNVTVNEGSTCMEKNKGSLGNPPE